MAILGAVMPLRLNVVYSAIVRPLPPFSGLYAFSSVRKPGAPAFVSESR